MKRNHEAMRAALARLEDDGRLTVDQVIAEAADPQSPLHSAFEWDRDKAARKYWEAQARELIRSFKVRVEVHDIIIRAPAYVPDPERSATYVSTIRLRGDEDRARDAAVAEFARAAAALQRAKTIAAVLGIAADIEMLHGQVLDLRQRVGMSVPAGTG